MDVLIQYSYRASRKEPFGALLRRIHDGLIAASLPVSYEFAFTDSPVGGGVSGVDRAFKKFPHLAPLLGTVFAPGMEGLGPKMISGQDTDLPFAALAEVADGLPRSLPFNTARVRFSGPEFGIGPAMVVAGITASDSWWVNGRQRSLVANFVVPESPKPSPAGALAVFLATMGKPAKTNRFPMSTATTKAHPELMEITQKYRARIGELIAEAGMPHSLPPLRDALTAALAAGSRRIL